jgi:phosphohistidine swiveling domain-containing protein
MPVSGAGFALADSAEPSKGRKTMRRPSGGQDPQPRPPLGRVRLVAASASLPELNAGDVLVAADAGALWTRNFPILARVVLECGSLGQHAAITAREFGLPAVVGDAQGTRRIPHGAWVTLDGARGTVEWELL